jgi:hypothetical protein
MGQAILPVLKHGENPQGTKTFLATLVHWQGVLELEKVSVMARCNKMTPVSHKHDRLAVFILCIAIDLPNETFFVHRGILEAHISSPSTSKAHRATQYGHHWITGFQGSNMRSIHQPLRRVLPRHPYPPPLPRSLPTTPAERVHPQLHRQLRRSSLD